MDVYWPVLLLLLLVAWIILMRIHEAIRKYPPSCIGLPVLGRLPMMALNAFLKKSNFYTEMATDGARKGDVWSTFLGMRRVVGLTSYDAIFDALSRQGQEFAWRPRMTDFTSYRMIDGTDSGDPTRVGGLVMSSGDLWKEQRRFALSVMRDLGMGKNLTEQKIQTEAQYLIEELKTLGGTAVVPKAILTRAVSNIISQFVFGFRSSYDSREFDEFHQFMKKVTQEGEGSMFLILLFPALENTFLTNMLGKKYIEADKEMMNFIEEKISKVEASMSTEDSDEQHFVGAFLRKVAKEPEGSSFCRKQLVITVYDLFAAGSETTSTFLNWAAIYLSYYRDWQLALQKELDEELGSLNNISYSDRTRCHKTMAFMDEVQRHATIVPHNVMHAVSRECFFRGCRIPENAFIIPDIRSAHLDPKVWTEPNRFDPGRFLNDAGEYRASKFLIPFSVGKRACLGESLARMEMFIFFATIVRNFEVDLDEEAKALKEEVFVGSVLDIHGPLDHKVIYKLRKE